MLQGKSTEAADLYRKSLALADSPETRLELASALLRAGDAAQAAQETVPVVQAEPDSSSAWAVRGSALRVAHREAEAADAFRHSLVIHPDANVAYALGSTLLALHQKEAAEKVFKQILNASGKDAIWFVAVGDALRENGYLQDAVTEFKAALARDPRAPHAEFFLGYTYLQMNQWGPNSQSFEHLRAAVQQSPHEYVSNFYLGALESTDGSDLASSNRHLHAAAEADPSQPEVWLYLGLNANREHDLAQAKSYLQKAIDLTGSDVARNNYQVRRAYFALGRILIAEGDRAHGEPLLARYKQAEQAAVAQAGVSIAGTMGPEGAAHALSSLPAPTPPAGTALQPGTQTAAASPVLPEAERKRLALAEAELRRVLAETYNDLGTAEARQQQYQVALEAFDNAETWQPPDPTLLRNVGVAAFRVQDYRQAAQALAAYLQHVADPHLRVMLAMSQFSMGDFPHAAENFNLAPDQTLSDARAAYSWAFSLARTGQQQHANQIAAQLTSLALPPDAMDLVCHVYMDTEAYEQSLACFRKLAEADPSMRMVHYDEGESLIRLDRPAEAIPELRQELALSPGNANVESSLGFALLQTSQKTEAMQALESAVQADPNHSQAQYQLGKLLLDNGDAAAAVTHLEIAERVDPSPDYVHYQLGTAYRKLGRTADAEREMHTYRDIKDKARAAATVPGR